MKIEIDLTGDNHNSNATDTLIIMEGTIDVFLEITGGDSRVVSINKEEFKRIIQFLK